jgi:hypothetical protein
MISYCSSEGWTLIRIARDSAPRSHIYYVHLFHTSPTPKLVTLGISDTHKENNVAWIEKGMGFCVEVL